MNEQIVEIESAASVKAGLALDHLNTAIYVLGGEALSWEVNEDYQAAYRAIGAMHRKAREFVASGKVA